MIKVVGLTGGIGSGKTTVAKLFKAEGIPIYIADVEAKKLLEDSAVIREEVIELLGPKTYDENGKPDRAFIASQVFDNDQLLKKLNAIIHPRVGLHFQEWKKQQTTPYVIYEAAIIFETGREDDFDYTILVKAPKAERIKRLKKRDNSTVKQIEARMANQWSDKEKEKLASFTIENIDLAVVKTKILQLHKILLNLINT